MPPTVFFVPADVLHLCATEIDLVSAVGVPEGAEAPESGDEVGAFSDEGLVDLPEGDGGEIVIDNVGETTVQ